MPLLLDRADGASAAVGPANGLTIGLVNTMPDAAFEATERQFTDLLRAAAAHGVILLKLFTIADPARSEKIRNGPLARYRDVAALSNISLDGLIVTGAEPRAKALKDEPHWPALRGVADWAKHNTASTVWSCLAAHAAVLHLDGIERRPLKQKRFGVFDCQLLADHPMTQHFPQNLAVPHSRYNDLSESALVSCGYRILTRSDIAGVDTFAKQDGSFFLFFQGHPEYEADSLLREYRRDVLRFLSGASSDYPDAPVGYFDDATAAAVAVFRARALAERRPELIAEFPKTALDLRGAGPWQPAAAGIYERWTAYLRARKAECRPVVPLRRTWRDWPPLMQPAGRPAR
jgi:homoserine O-succinyltransferase